MNEPLLFKDVKISRMYGSMFDLHLSNLSAHLNIVFGPNGAGKTTIANALNGLLLPSAGRQQKLYAEANLTFGRQTLHIDVQSNRAICRVGTNTVDRNELSHFIRPKSYHLSLHELLPEKSGDSDLAKEIIRQANGGFDISAAGRQLEFALQKQYRKTTEGKEFDTASKRVQEVLSEQRSLRDRKNQREQAQNELNSAKEATKRVSFIKKVQTWRSAERECKTATTIANQYPDVIKNSHDLTNAVTHAQKFADRINQLKRSLEESQTSIAQIEKRLSHTQLPPKGLAPEDLSHLSSLVQDCSAKFRELEQLKESFQTAEEQSLDAWDKLGGIVPQGWRPSFTPEHLKHLREFAKEYDSHLQEQKALQLIKTRLEGLDSDDRHGDSHDLQVAQQIVLNWILALKSDFPATRKINSLLWITFLASAFLSIGSGVTLHPIGFVGLLISSLILWIYLLLRSDSQHQAAPLRKDLLKRLLPDLPDHPDPSELLSGLDQLIIKRSQVELHNLKSTEMQRVQQFLDKNMRQQPELDAKKEGLLNSFNLPPPNDLILLIELVDRLLSWRKIDQKVNEVESRYNIASESYDALIKTTGDAFERHGYERPNDPRNAEKLLEKLKQDDDAVKRDHASLAQAETTLASIKNQLNDEEAKYVKVFTDLNLDVGDLSGLANCAREFTEWNKASSEANKLNIRSQSLRPDIDPSGKYGSLMEIENVEEELQVAQEEAQKQEELQQQLTRLDADIERAETSNSMENALAEKERKRIALEHVREEKAAKAVGQVIVEYLSESTIKNAPPVFQLAQENFERVTDGRYTLIIPQDDSFRTHDNQRNRDFNLSELSSATRVQLLLSVRLAFVETQESNHRLPITLDETLANSDDERARAIIKTISTLAADRQIFYFTAQKDEVDKWCDYVPKDQLKIHPIG